MKGKEFIQFIEDAPRNITDLLVKCNKTEQSPIHHPEGNVLKHTMIVFNRAKKHNDVNLMLAAIFHDLGKPDTTKLNKRGEWSAHGHEELSTEIVEKNRKWIEQKGGDFDLVHFLVSNHMRIGRFDEMRKSKQEKLKNHKFFDKLLTFSELDNMKTLSKEELF